MRLALGPELGIGAEWDEARRRRADVAADEEGAWRAALRALERRSFAEVELRRRLRQKGHPPAAVDYVIDRARGAGLLDDAAVCPPVRGVARGAGPGAGAAAPGSAGAGGRSAAHRGGAAGAVARAGRGARRWRASWPNGGCASFPAPARDPAPAGAAPTSGPARVHRRPRGGARGRLLRSGNSLTRLGRRPASAGIFPGL